MTIIDCQFYASDSLSWDVSWACISKLLVAWLYYALVEIKLSPFPATDIRPRKSEKRPTDEQRLYKYLMKNYDPNTRPVFNASHPVNVSIGITLTQIFDVVSRTHNL